MNYTTYQMNELALLLALLVSVPKLVFRLGSKLGQIFPEVAELFSASATRLAAAGITDQEIAQLKQIAWDRVAAGLQWSEGANRHIITSKDPRYPQLLHEIPNPPLLLFAEGDCTLLQAPQLAIVGSRNPSPGGVETAFLFAKALGQLGLVITSGFAAGIDAASHRGALAGLGRTIAVMGTGLEHLYPSYHKTLAQQIVAAGGLLLSEFPLQVGPRSWHFPWRNRLISGLSLGALVVEATVRSGSLITARLAGEQGREVFAVPGSIYNPLARGTHCLIQQGAKLVTQPEDIVTELPAISHARTLRREQREVESPKNKLDRAHRKLLDCIGFEPTTVAALVLRTQLPVSQVKVMLVDLELAGFVQSMLNGYVRV